MIRDNIAGYPAQIKARTSKLLQNTHILFLCIFTPAFLLFVNITPLSWGLDETVHVARAYQISEGNMYPDHIKDGYLFGGDLPVTLIDALNEGRETSREVRRDLPFYHIERSDGEGLNKLDKLSGEPINSTLEQRYVFGTTGPYSPVVYAPASVGILLGKILNLNILQTITLAKILQGAMYAVTVYLSLRLLRRTKAKWIVLIIACLPASVFQVTTINADVFTNLSIILFCSIMIKIFLQKEPLTQKQEILLFSSSILVAMTKPSYAFALLLIAFIPKYLYSTSKRMYISKLAALLSSISVLFAISLKGLVYSSTNAVNFTKEQAANMSLGGQIEFMLGHPVAAFRAIQHTIIDLSNGWMHSIISTIGDNIVAPPYPFIVLTTIAMVIATLYFSGLKRVQALALVGVSTIAAMSIIVILYGTVNEIGAEFILGVQGRYFIPCFLLFLLAVGSLVRIRMHLNDIHKIILIVMPTVVSLYGMVYVFSKSLF